MNQDLQRRWNRLVVRIRTEFEQLPCSERDWIATQTQEIARVQRELQGLFEEGGGSLRCCSCLGECCQLGKNHMGLVNILACLSAQVPLAQADFSRSCPFLGDRGCLVALEQRPFNCLTFICEEIELAMGPQNAATFYALEKELRVLYLGFNSRYLGAGLTGLLIRGERAGERPLLGSP